MTKYETTLSKQERNWILERRFTRLTDNKEVQIYPMGAERYLSSALSETNKNRYKLKEDIQGKNVLVIPGHGNSCFIFAHEGAQSVTVYDKDPVTIAWMKAFKKYYHFRQKEEGYPSVGELLIALTKWYPPLIQLPKGNVKNALFWIVQPNLLRRVYIHYMVDLVVQAIQSKTNNQYELENNIQFHDGTINALLSNKEATLFDTVFVPYLLGVRNGIENEVDISQFIQQLIALNPNGRVFITPASNKKEFYIAGTRYFTTTNHENISSIPSLQSYLIDQDKGWFRMQGLVAFGSKIEKYCN